ncbi:hypothetical protein ACSXAY_02525 [Clostridium perfringens]
MNIPSKIRVGSMDYDVILTDEKIINLDGEECLGLTDHNLHEIKISTSLQNEQGQEKTFLHELIHAMIEERNLDFECIIEEILAEDLSSILYQVIRDNPEIFKEYGALQIGTKGIKVTETEWRVGEEPKTKTFYSNGKLNIGQEENKERVETLLEKIKLTDKNVTANKLEILRMREHEGGAEYLIFNDNNIPGVKGYSIDKKEKEFPTVTITLDCPNINIINGIKKYNKED